MNVYQKLNEARNRFHALKLTKTGHNKFAGYNYFELGDFLVPALKVLHEVGLCAVVSFDADKACMLIRNVEKPDECLTIYSPMGSAALKGCHEVQNIGAVETYQRRYLWVAALEIVEHDALDATTGKDKPEKRQEPAGSLVPVLEASIERAKEKSGRRGVAQDVLTTSPELSPTRKAKLEWIAGKVVDEFNAYGAQAAFERIQQEALNDETEHVFLETFFPSNVRNQITAYSREFHNRKVPA